MNSGQPPHVFAAVDLGSNSFHMIVASFKNGQLQVIDRERDMVRLAAGLKGSGKISRKASERALDCIRRFGKLTRDMHADVVRAVGTETLRRATNARVFVREAEEILGHPIEVVSGEEEARLVYLGAMHSLPEVEGRRLVVDIGGGSTELILGERFEPGEMFSLDLGCVEMTEEFFPGGKITEKSWKRAKRAAIDELKPLRSELTGWEDAIGTSGTIRSIQRVSLAQGWSKKDIQSHTLKKLEQYLVDCGHVDDVELKGLSFRRAPVFAGGVVILQAVFSVLDIESMHAARGALREGLVYDMLADVNPNFQNQV